MRGRTGRSWDRRSYPPWPAPSHAGGVRTNRAELARALKRARGRVRPEDVGLPAGLHRRVPGLRREELAMLAGISVDYVVRLEQARGPQPSEQVLTALCRALRLDTDERDHVFHLAGTAPPHSGHIDLHVRPSVLRLIDRFNDLPALVTSAKGDVLAWNAMSSALHGDWSSAAPGAAQPAAAPVPARPDRPAAQHRRGHAGRARRHGGADRGQPPLGGGPLPRRPGPGPAAGGAPRGLGGVPRAVGRARTPAAGAATPRP